MEESQELTHLAQLCRLRAQTHPDHVALDDGAVRLTYRGLRERADAVAAYLRGLDIGVGDSVVLQGRNRVAWVVAAFGVLTAGATLAPVNHGLPGAERQRLLERLRPALVFSEVADPSDQHYVAFGDLMALPPAPQPSEHPPLDSDTPALLLSSSGTTGDAKVVAMTHRQLTRLYSDVADVLGVRETDTMLAIAPLAHSLGFNGILLVAMMVGAAVRLCPTYSRESTPSLIVEEQVSVLSGPPTLFHDLERHAGADGLQGKARLAIVGGQTVLIGELLATARRLGLREVVIGYGMTEACGTVALARLNVEPVSVETQVALTVMPGVEVRIAASGDGVGDGANLPGPILVRGYNIVPLEGAGPDEWFDTGDVGLMDAEGRLIVVGRSTDRVIVSGFNVHPRDVERVLASHPGVEQVVVIGVPDKRTGERLVACVVTRRPEMDLHELRTFAREHLMGYQVPAEILPFVDLPLTASGKIARSELLNRVIGIG